MLVSEFLGCYALDSCLLIIKFVVVPTTCDVFKQMNYSGEEPSNVSVIPLRFQTFVRFHDAYTSESPTQISRVG